MYDMLNGLKVLECGILKNGAQAGMYFADLGAEVVKIEDTNRGDYIRDIMGQVRPRESPNHLQVNKNKKSLAIDLRSEEGREIFFELLKTSDVFIDGLRPGACDRMGIGYEAQRAVKPDIIYIQCTGYGASGPYAAIPTHGYQMTALPGGLPARMGPEGKVERTRGVQYMGGVEESSAASGLAGQAAALAGMAAVIRRDRSGQGAYIDVAASDAVLAASWSGAVYNFNYDRITDFRGAPKKQASYEAKWPQDSVRYQLYQTADEKFLLFAALEKKFWEAFCRVGDREDLIDTMRPDMANDFGEDKPWLRDEVQKVIGARTLSEWMELAAAHGLPIGPAHNLEDVPSDPHIKAREILIDAHDPEGGDFTYVGFPARIDGRSYGNIERAPRHGQDTVEYLRGAGITQAKIEEMLKKSLLKQA